MFMSSNRLVLGNFGIRILDSKLESDFSLQLVVGMVERCDSQFLILKLFIFPTSLQSIDATYVSLWPQRRNV